MCGRDVGLSALSPTAGEERRGAVSCPGQSELRPAGQVCHWGRERLGLCSILGPVPQEGHQGNTAHRRASSTAHWLPGLGVPGGCLSRQMGMTETTETTVTGVEAGGVTYFLEGPYLCAGIRTGCGGAGTAQSRGRSRRTLGWGTCSLSSLLSRDLKATTGVKRMTFFTHWRQM